MAIGQFHMYKTCIDPQVTGYRSMSGGSRGLVALLAIVQCHVSKTYIDLEATGQSWSQRICYKKSVLFRIYRTREIREGAKNIPRGVPKIAQPCLQVSNPPHSLPPSATHTHTLLGATD